jgi:putative SOS response-associated peptidase YedK
MKGHRWFCMAGIWRDAHVGEAFSLLTMDAGPDIAPYHHRQIIPLPRDKWAAWLDPRTPAEAVLQWLPSGILEVAQVYGKPPAQGALAL